MGSDCSDEKVIDIEDVIRKKFPKLLRYVPRFIIRYLKNVIHEDELNTNICKYRDYQGFEFTKKMLGELGTHCEVYGRENIPDSGRFIFAANHPLGGLDGMMLINEVGKKFPDLKFVVTDLLLNVKNFESIFVPVNKYGKQSSEYVKKIEATYASDTQILYFPAGYCSRKINGQITDLIWHKSFISKAIQYQRDIIPVYFEAQNSNFFYRLSKIRKMLGIKASIETFYLVDEMFKQRNKTIKLVFGSPVSYVTLDKSKSPAEWASYLRERVYNLRTSLY